MNAELPRNESGKQLAVPNTVPQGGKAQRLEHAAERARNGAIELANESNVAMRTTAARYSGHMAGDARNGAIELAAAPSEAMRAAAARRLQCAPKDVRASAVEQVPGAFFFSTGPCYGAPRVLIDAAGEQLWRPSAYSPARHVRDWLAGERN